MRICEVCDFTQSSLLIAKRFMTPYLFEGNAFTLNYRQCDNCGFIFLENPISSLHLSTYYANCGHMQKREKTYVYKSQYDFIMRTMNPDVEVESVLDVGCGDFNFLSIFQSNVLKTGIDIRIETNSENCEIEYFDGLFSEFPETKSYTLVCFRHLLEHLVDISEILKKASRLIARNGYLYIEVPDLYFFGNLKYINTDFSFEHTNYFSVCSLHNLLRKCNYDLVNMKQEYDPDGMPYGVIKCLARKCLENNNGLQVFDNDKQFTNSIVNKCLKNQVHKKHIIYKKIKSSSNSKKIAFHGAGGSGIEMINYINSVDKEMLSRVEVFFDNDPKKAGKKLNGKSIVHPENYTGSGVDFIYILSAVEVKQIKKQLKRLFGNSVKIVTPFIL